MWYVIQTTVGKEEELISWIQTMVAEKLYQECFIIKAEWMKRLGGVWQVQAKPLFPGYVFIDTTQPEKIFFRLKNIPKFSKLLGNEAFEFIAVDESEELFLNLISEKKREYKILNGLCYDLKLRLVHLTKIDIDEDGKIFRLKGILRYFEKDIVKLNFHKRYAVVKIDMFCKQQTLIFGIMLNQDKLGGEAFKDVSKVY